MAIRVVYSSGNGTVGTATTLNPTSGEWATAYATLAAALAASTSADTILIAHDHSEAPAAAITLAFPITPGLRAYCIDRTTWALADSAQVYVASGANLLSLTGCGYVRGVKFAGGTGTSATASIHLGNSTAGSQQITLDSCELALRSTSAGAIIQFGNLGATANDENYVALRNTKIGFGAVGQSINVRNGRYDLSAVSAASGTTSPTSLFSTQSGTVPQVNLIASDLSGLGFTNLVSVTASTISGRLKVANCVMPSGWSSIFATAPDTLGAFEVTLVNSGPTASPIKYGFYSATGSLTLDTTIKYTGTPADCSWKIVTNASCSRASPFVTPWLEWTNPGTSAITPRFEILRDGSTTAYTDAEIAAEFMAAITSGSPLGSIRTDAAAADAAGTAQAAGAGLASWSGESGSAWSGKIDSAASVTPITGYPLLGRAVVTAASATVYVDPCIRT